MIIGESIQFNYTGNVQKIELLPGVYQLECYGAGGGSDSYRGGYGGYAKGIFETEEIVTAYIYVGGAGASSVSGRGGGYNGGGNAGGTGTSGAGGGASDIRINSTSLYARIIVAAGGGGGGNSYGDRIGGYGGGTNGYQPNGAGPAGTQNSGYAFGQGQHKSGNGGGGDGGWYGGYSSYGDGGGSGGSGYVYTRNTKKYYPSGCLLGNINFLKNTLLQNAKNPNGYHGYIIITFLENIKDKRKKSNLYKDSYYQEHFDFNKLLEV